MVVLTIGKAHLTVTADNQARLYGGANPTFSETISGFVNGEDVGVVSGTALGSSTATSTTGVGSVAIMGGTGTLSASNYDFSPVDGTLTIGKAHLTVTADNQARLYGGANPTFSETISGFVNGEDVGVVSGTALGSSTATSTTSVGSATIVANAAGLSANNYDFSEVNGILTITAVFPPVIILNNLNINPVATISGGSVTSINFGSSVLINNGGAGTSIPVGLFAGSAIASTSGSSSVNGGSPTVAAQNSGSAAASTSGTGSSLSTGGSPIVGAQDSGSPAASTSGAGSSSTTGGSSTVVAQDGGATDSATNSNGTTTATTGSGGSTLPVNNVSNGSITVKLVNLSTPQATGLVNVLVSNQLLISGSAFQIPLPNEVTNTMIATNSVGNVSLAGGVSLPGWITYDEQARLFVVNQVPVGALPLTVQVQVSNMNWNVVISSSNIN